MSRIVRAQSVPNSAPAVPLYHGAAKIARTPKVDCELGKRGGMEKSDGSVRGTIADTLDGWQGGPVRLPSVRAKRAAFHAARSRLFDGLRR